MRPLLSIPVLPAVLAAIPLSIAHAEDCSNAMTQPEMNACAYEAYKKSDAELNALYKQVMKRLKGDSDATKRLVTAQRAWIAFRDAECTFVTRGRPSAGYTMYPMVLSYCRKHLTSARVNDLKSYLRCEEGDVMCPLPPE